MADLVSIVIPCHNAAEWLAETLDSTLLQEGVATQIILVDDGSTDGSVDVARRIGGNRIQIIQQPQSGASRARTSGTAAALGNFIQYLDADDVLLPGTLVERVRALSGGAGVAYCDWVRWTWKGDGVFGVTSTTTRTLSERPDVDILTDAWWPPGALLYRRSIVEQIGPWREDLPIIQDARFLLDAALVNASFVHVPAVGLKYRVHRASSLSRRDPRAFLEDCFRNAQQLHSQWRASNELDPERHAALLQVYTYVARSFFQSDRQRFHEVLTTILDLSPDFLPTGPPRFRALARILGYPAAEYVSSWFRRVKGIVTSPAADTNAA